MNKKLNTRITLSLIWIVIMFNMIFNDFFSIMVELVDGDTINIPMEVKTMMLVAGIITNIPIIMIMLSYILKQSISRKLNIIAGFFTIFYVTAGGSLLPHYVLIASIEVLLCIVIIIIAWRWKNSD